MIVTKTFYSVKCDKCGKKQVFDCEGNDCSESDAEADFEIDENAAFEVAKCNGWEVCRIGDEDFCPECWEEIGDLIEQREDQSNWEAYEELKRLEPDVYE